MWKSFCNQSFLYLSKTKIVIFNAKIQIHFSKLYFILMAFSNSKTKTIKFLSIYN